MELPLIPPKLTRQNAACFDISYVCDLCCSIMKTERCKSCYDQNLCPYCESHYHYCQFCSFMQMDRYFEDNDKQRIQHYVSFQSVMTELKRQHTKRPSSHFEVNFPELFNQWRCNRLLWEHNNIF